MTCNIVFLIGFLFTYHFHSCYSKAGPGKPTNVAVIDSGDKQLTVSWEDPENLNVPLDGVSAIARAKGLVKGHCNWTAPDDKNCIIKGLSFYTDYTITAVGYNKPVDGTASGGYGEESTPVPFKTRPGKPGPPTDLTVLAVVASELTVSWLNPLDTNGPLDKTTVTAVSVDSVASSKTCVTINAARTCNITGLSDYTNYNLSVLTYNEPLNNLGGGQSLASENVIKRTLAGKPTEIQMNEITEAINNRRDQVTDGTTQLSIFLKLSEINTTHIGPVSKVTIVVSPGDSSQRSKAHVIAKMLPWADEDYVDGTYMEPKNGVYEVKVPSLDENVYPQLLKDTEFVLGEPKTAAVNDHIYNGPLFPATKYSISVRIYTESGYETTNPTILETEAVGVNIGLIVGCIVGGLVFIGLIVFIVYLIKSRNNNVYVDDDVFSSKSAESNDSVMLIWED